MAGIGAGATAGLALAPAKNAAEGMPAEGPAAEASAAGAAGVAACSEIASRAAVLRVRPAQQVMLR